MDLRGVSAAGGWVWAWGGRECHDLNLEGMD